MSSVTELIKHVSCGTIGYICQFVVCLSFTSGKRAVAGYEDGSVRVFDLKSGQLLHQLTDDSEDVSAVINMTVQKDDALIVFGATNGKAKIFSPNNGKVRRGILKFYNK